jgi:arylsulfatase A-like enzyme
MATSKSTLAVIGLGILAITGAVAWLALKPKAPESTVVLVVLDTVRADRLTPCGYERDTTPNLQALVDQGASFTCSAYAPGSWTLPSHASYFTGVSPLVHRAHAISSGIDSFEGSGARSRPLDGTHTTLAEELRLDGFKTHLFSANPLVNEVMGLTRGYDHVLVTERFGAYNGPAFNKHFSAFIADVDPADGPHFLTVNLADAHQPWSPVPSTVAWHKNDHTLPYRKGDEDGFWAQFVRDELPPLEQQVIRERANDLYDYNLSKGDRNLGVLIDHLIDGGFCDAAPCRFIVVSDHGEFLGEHQLLDHGHEVYEPNVRVPLLVTEIGTGADPSRAPELPELVNAQVVFDLALTGALPETLPSVVSMAWPHARRCKHTHGAGFCSISVAQWLSPTDKQVWRDGEFMSFDLAADPGELNPGSLQPDPWLEAIAEDVKRDERDDGDVNTDVIELLRAAGYMD